MSADPYDPYEDEEDEEAPSSVTLPDDDPLAGLTLNQYTDHKAVAYKTVNMFAGITKRRLWLKNFKFAQTDGNEIRIPFADPDSYLLLEHELSHILFGSDANGRQLFVDDYVKKVAAVNERLKFGVEISTDKLTELMQYVIGVLEDHRVNQLWAHLYAGSGHRLQVMVQEDSQQLLDKFGKDNLPIWFAVIAGNIEVQGSRWDGLYPYARAALQMVEGRGFMATLVAAKWLLQRMVDEILRQKPPPQPQSGAGNPSPNQNKSKQSKDKQSGGSGAGASGAKDDADTDDADAEANASADKDDSDDTDDSPAPPPATPQQRAEALAELVDDLLSYEFEQAERLRPLNDFTSNRMTDGNDLQAMRQVSAAIRADLNDAETLRKLMALSEAEMQRIIDAAKAALQQQLTLDGLLQRDARAKVIFVDKKGRDDGVTLSREELDTVRRLRALFYQVMGRRSAQLEETGLEPDVAAYVENMVMHSAQPCFRQEHPGRGFDVMVLVDRSGSMYGSRSLLADRAARIVSAALKFPFVNLRIWGFQSLNMGEVTITRFDTSAAGRQLVGGASGYTPLHTAVRLGAHALEAGSSAKQLIVVTDGHPVFGAKEGGWIKTGALMRFVRNEVRDARFHGINVTGVVIGGELGPKQMQYMFGTQRNWRIMNEKRFDRELIDLVSRSFSNYLRHG